MNLFHVFCLCLCHTFYVFISQYQNVVNIHLRARGSFWLSLTRPVGKGALLGLNPLRKEVVKFTESTFLQAWNTFSL